MTIEDAERIVRVLGAVLAGTTWAIAAVGAARARRRPGGRAMGVARREGVLGAYLLIGVPYLVVCVALWRPLPVQPTGTTRVACLVAGSALGATGAALYLWGRWALGNMYNVSSSLGSELFADHRLVVTGPYRFVRHPMYLGIVLGVVGALLVYRTWTTVFMVLALPGLAVKARHEDRLLAEELDGPFEDYRTRVPAWMPRLRRDHRRTDPQGQRSDAVRAGGSSGRDPRGPVVMRSG